MNKLWIVDFSIPSQFRPQVSEKDIEYFRVGQFKRSIVEERLLRKAKQYFACRLRDMQTQFALDRQLLEQNFQDQMTEYYLKATEVS